MSNQIQKRDASNELVKLTPETMSKLALSGDVAGLSQVEKVQYYAALCQRVGLDPATQPFKLMKLNGKETFYLDRSGAQQLNRVHQISHEIKSRDFVNGCYVVTARASIGSRFTDSIGTVACDGLKGEAFANATMKAETKAKRRATLDLVGLGMLDESEVETIPNAMKADAPAVLMPSRPQNAPIAQPESSAEHSGESFEASAPPTKSANPAKPDISGWKGVVVPKFIKKYSGQTLGDMPDKDLRWWAENYEPKPFRGEISAADRDFRAALDLALNDLNDKEDSTPEQADQSQDTVPF